VNNLSDSAQAVELDLRKFKGFIPIEMFGETLFPRIGDNPYLLTMGPYQFYWFRLRKI
jgi:maltose alpha-D-glucosyltransferase/alpha-amylase